MLCKKEGYAKFDSNQIITAVTGEYAPFIVVEKVTTAVSGDVIALKIQGRNVSTQKEASFSETYLKSSLPAILVCNLDGNKPSLVEAKELYEFADTNHYVMLYSNNATPKAAIIYDYPN